MLEGRGRLLLPGLVEAHTHLDKTLLGMSWYRNEVGPRLVDKIENERAARRALPIPPRRQSARQVALSVGHGTAHIRSHVDVDTECGLDGIEGVLATKDALRELCTIQVVAFPQSGLLVRPGTLELLDAALRLGADAVGGLDPCSIDRDPKGHLDAVFGLADRHGKGVDVHLHEPGELGLFSLELIVERARALGMAGRVVVSHAFCLGHPDPALVDPALDALAAAGVAIMTTGAPSRPVPPVKRLAAAGVVVCAGSDSIRDTWGPYGNADMLERAALIGLRNNLRRDDELASALDVVTAGGARALGLEGYGLHPAPPPTWCWWRRKPWPKPSPNTRAGAPRSRPAAWWRTAAGRSSKWSSGVPGRTLLTARWVVGHEGGRHVLLEHGEVVFEGERVAFVGHGFPREVAERRDLGFALIGPGLVDLDALGDLDTTVLALDNQPPQEKGRVWPRDYAPREMYAPDELAFQKRYAFAQLLRHGVTTALPIASLFYRTWGETWDEFAATPRPPRGRLGGK